MEIYYEPDHDWGGANYSLGGKDGCKRYTSITVGTATPHWRTTLCHEIAHCLCSKPGQCGDTKGEIRREIIAWRVAKSFCKAKYWNEEWAIESLKTYTTYWEIDINWGKFKIIPLNTNKWYSPGFKFK